MAPRKNKKGELAHDPVAISTDPADEEGDAEGNEGDSDIGEPL